MDLCSGPEPGGNTLAARKRQVIVVAEKRRLTITHPACIHAAKDRKGIKDQQVGIRLPEISTMWRNDALPLRCCAASNRQLWDAGRNGRA